MTDTDEHTSSEGAVDILWTGGSDSTYRVLSLLLDGRTVRPHYLEYPGRSSVPEERAAMAEIRAGAEARGWGDRLLPLVVVSTEDLAEDADVEARLAELKTRSHCGTQYGYLARYARQRLDGRRLDLSVHLDDRGEFFVGPYAIASEDGDGFVLGPGADEATRLFDPFRFPLLHETKEGMAASAEERGFADLMASTWFCHNPIRRSGRPSEACGVCAPCRYTHEEGMGHRIGAAGHIRRITTDILSPVAKPFEALRFRLGVGQKLRALLRR